MAVMMLLMAVPVSASAANVKLSKTTMALCVGQKKTLTVKNTKKKVTWSSSKKGVASVSSKGVVKGKKEGKAKITAKVGNKKYTCTVVVKKSELANWNIIDNNKSSWSKVKSTKLGDYTIKAYPGYMYYDSDGNLNIRWQVKNKTKDKTIHIGRVMSGIKNKKNDKYISEGVSNNLNIDIKPGKTKIIWMTYNNGTTEKFVNLNNNFNFSYYFTPLNIK